MDSHLRWTWHGASYALGGAALLIVGARLGSTAVTLAGGILIFMVAFDAALVQARSPKIALRVAPRRVEEEGNVRVEVTGQGFHENHQLHVPLAAGLRLKDRANVWTPAGRTGGHDFGLIGQVRGPQQVGPVEIRTWSGARLWARDFVAEEPQDVEVVPRASSVEGIGILSRLVKPMQGRFTANRPGQGFDFFTLRQYQSGDTIRAVNWKASARKDDDLIVNQRQRETHSEVLILLDARAASGIGPVGRTPLDWGCRIVLGLYTEAVANRDTVRFAAYGSDMTRLPVGTVDRIQAMESLLASLGADGNLRVQHAWEHVRTDMRGSGPIFFVTSCEADPSLETAIGDMAGRGHPVTVLSPSPVGIEQEPDRHEARMQAIESVRDRGAIVLDWHEGMPLVAEKPILGGRVA